MSRETGDRPANPPGGRRVLVVEDRDEVRQLVCELLGHLGFEAEAVAGGAEAVEAVRCALEAGSGFHAAILDLALPGGMSGTEVLARLREIDPGLRALAVSGYATDPVLAEPARYGFDAALAKPFALAELAEAMARVTGE